ncbi:hypothetical protein CI105_08600 [Candidatus Izimaplasma bacterium ZiA1]|uniref:hypothetical protein n=1 Tax=Candidatus Izimoplasma sp. ZiA1 TaxID=2024899 RepID=UPI000BAA5B36|nr:hypothetical protein CI105_08600 [Candidatus Izimaplasma bacterium ZiA1]
MGWKWHVPVYYFILCVLFNVGVLYYLDYYDTTPIASGINQFTRTFLAVAPIVIFLILVIPELFKKDQDYVKLILFSMYSLITLYAISGIWSVLSMYK